MIVSELLELLEGVSPDAEVRLATQPSWPFEYSVSTVVEAEISEVSDTLEELQRELDELEELKTSGSWTDEDEADMEALLDRISDLEDEEEKQEIVYLAEGSQLGYLPGSIKEQLGWGRY